MNKNAAYRKTAKGLEEMSTRAHRLSSRARSLLIMLDGTLTAEAIIGTAQNLAETEAYFDQLLSEGFIEPVEGSAPDAQEGLGEATRFAVGFLLKRLGPDADGLAMEIEACKSADQLRALVKKYQASLKFLGEKSVEDFAQGTLSRLPA